MFLEGENEVSQNNKKSYKIVHKAHSRGNKIQHTLNLKGNYKLKEIR
jgi:hypothetical protein